MNGAFLDPEGQTLIVTARIEDVSLTEDADQHTVTFMVSNLDEGIEVFHGDERLWKPA